MPLAVAGCYVAGPRPAARILLAPRRGLRLVLRERPRALQRRRVQPFVRLLKVSDVASRAKPRVDVTEVLRSYSRTALHDFREGAKTLGIAYDRGGPREHAVREFLRQRLPGRYGVGEGIVIDGFGGQSRQCDVVIYDRERMPALSTRAGLSVWPVEFVYGAVEVKSTLTKTELRDAVRNIATFKQLRRRHAGPGPGAGRSRKLVGMLIAHDLGRGLNVRSATFNEVVASVPDDQQLDACCVVSGEVVCRGAQIMGGGGGMLTLEGPSLLPFDCGDRALGAFLLMAIGLLNEIDLGQPTLYLYLKSLFLAER